MYPSRIKVCAFLPFSVVEHIVDHLDIRRGEGKPLESGRAAALFTRLGSGAEIRYSARFDDVSVGIQEEIIRRKRQRQGLEQKAPPGDLGEKKRPMCHRFWNFASAIAA